MDPIYVDLDDTLIHPEEGRHGRVVRIHPRPGAGEFIRKLTRHGDVYILSHATLPHVMGALPAIGPGADLLSGVISREDLQPVIDELERIATLDVSDRERERLREEIIPIVPSGVLFDDQKIGSWHYIIKSTAAGIGPGMWIRVPPYNPPRQDDAALEQAYRKFHRVFVGTALKGKRSSA